MASRSIWADEKLSERLRALILEGYSAAQIANELSTVDAPIGRDAVVGRAFRLGLKLGGGSNQFNRVRHAQERPSGAVARRTAAEKKKVTVATVAPARKEPVAASEKGMALIERLTWRQAERARVLDFISRNEAAVAAGGVPFLERRADECAWMLGSGYKAKVCGKVIERGSYCSEHAAMAYQTEVRRKRLDKPFDPLVTKKKPVEEEDLEEVAFDDPEMIPAQEDTELEDTDIFVP